MSFLAPLCIVSALIVGPQEKEWGVHDMERPLPPRIEGAKAVCIPPPEGATLLFDGADLSQWQQADGSDARWQVSDGYFQAKPGAGDLQTRIKLADQHLHLEWRVPESEAEKTGQNCGNSGVFLMGLYEVQVLETSTNRTYADGMAGALYGQFPPMVNVGAGIGEWNSYDIYFRAPRFKSDQAIEHEARVAGEDNSSEPGEMESPAWITVFHNGYVIHEHQALLGATVHKARAKYSPHADQLPLRLQDHGEPTQFRNVWVRPLPDAIEGLFPVDFPMYPGIVSSPIGGIESGHDLVLPPRDSLHLHVENLSAIDPRPEGAHPVGMQIASTYIASQLDSMGYEVRSQTFYSQGQPYRNVSVRLGPKEGPLTVVGAHYDVCNSSPGADDNASGVAVLLELARALKVNPPKSSIELVFYALEEPPYFRTADMGSAHHAQALKAAGTKVRGMISLEMLGYYDETEGSQSYPNPALAERYPKAGNFLALVARPEDQAWLTQMNEFMSKAMTLPLETLAAPRQLEGVDFSDHASYWDAGFTAMMLTDTAHLRNPNYHQKSDTADTLNYENMAQIVAGLAASLRAFDKQ